MANSIRVQIPYSYFFVWPNDKDNYGDREGDYHANQQRNEGVPIRKYLLIPSQLRTRYAL